MKQTFIIKKPKHIRTKIIGIILILIGLYFLVISNTIPFIPKTIPFISNTLLNMSNSLKIKISFTSILIGVFWIFLIPEKSIPKNLSNALNKGTFDAIEKLLRGLSGNAVFLPKSEILAEERIYISQAKTDDKPPFIDNHSVLIRKPNMKILGIALPPSGLKLLKEIEKEVNFKDIGLENVEESLDKFIGLNLVKSIILKKQDDKLKLIIKKPVSCRYNQNLCQQYPCPVCSAAITGIVHATNKIVRIIDVKIENEKIMYILKIED